VIVVGAYPTRADAELVQAALEVRESSPSFLRRRGRHLSLRPQRECPLVVSAADAERAADPTRRNRAVPARRRGHIAGDPEDRDPEVRRIVPGAQGEVIT